MNSIILGRKKQNITPFICYFKRTSSSFQYIHIQKNIIRILVLSKVSVNLKTKLETKRDSLCQFCFFSRTGQSDLIISPQKSITPLYLSLRTRKTYIQQIIMNIQSNSYENTNPKCKGCKMFFGAQSFHGYCSTCFKKRQETLKQLIEKIKIDPSQAGVAQPIQQEEPKRQLPQQKDRNRCKDCNRKVGMLGIECKCGYVFCNKHRMPQDHKCSIDYMTLGTKKLQKNLIKIIHNKIDKLD